MSKPATISAAIITLDEAHNLPGLFAALDWVDEIVVVDGGSADGTADVARSHGCRVLEHPFDTFAQQRNRALRLANCDWVLSIDADERPTQRLMREIREGVDHGALSAYRIPVRSWIFGARFRYSGTQHDRPVRLIKRGAGQWRGAVHETLVAHGPIGELTSPLLHETLPDLAAFVAKMRRYTTLEAQARVARGELPLWRDQLLRPVREIVRRLIWKWGLLDGPAGWAFCLLSGWSEWTLARKHRQLWREQATIRGRASLPWSAAAVAN